MSANTETPSSGLDVLKWVVAIAIVSAAVVGNWYYAEQPLLYRVLAVLAAGIVAAVVALQTVQGVAFWALVKEARVEIRKVVWPTHQETTQTTLIVVVVVILMGLLLWGLDSLLSWIVSLIIG